MHLDRRTHHGDPPAWLPAFWSEPGIYPLSPESVSIITMVSSLPFDRHVTTTNTSPSTAGMLGGGQPMFPGNLLPNMLGGIGMVGNPRNMMMETTRSMSPMINVMHPLLQQQQYQRMLQYQKQQQKQQQHQQQQAMPVSPMTPSPSPSSYTQRKPITPQPMGNTIPHLQFASSPVENRPKKAKTTLKKQPSVSTPNISPTSNSVPSKIQRKQVKKSLSAEKRRVRFTEDQPQVNVFEPEAHSMDDMDLIYQNAYYDDGPMPTRHIGSDEDYYYGDDDHYGACDDYDEMEYDHRHYPDHDYYYYSHSDNSEHADRQDGTNAPRSTLRRKSDTMEGRTPIYEDYEDDYGYEDNMIDGYDMGYCNYSDDDDDNGVGGDQDYSYSNESYEKGQLHHRPRSSMDFDHGPAFYPASPSQLQHARRRHSASSGGVIQNPQQPQQQQHHSPMARRPPLSSANPRMWQPSRGNHQQ